ncbi:flagellar motor protein MotA [Rhodospirillaceae bacterium KN72]|uniref:Flagellar motor protein MotA n=1 Tax=Pacificispira spongiicola TaxID=2729598 RepID=A0A7Y0HH59_9PROT|nr:MotA/TolQ/ExbB proton channel family protein [Pacificispira spongiicola]NMM46358.1 flagellar motor protein MotA [Pacificispira spongiicola]
MALQSDQSRSGERPLTQPSTRGSVDLATILGLIGAAALVGSAIVLGGSPSSFVDWPSVLIVIGGTFGVVTACFSLRDIAESARIIGRAFFRSNLDAGEAALQLLQLAQIARFRGVLAIQNYMPAVEDREMLRAGLAMVVDGTPGEDVERIMRREVQSTAQRSARAVSILKKAAEISPAMGLIGTLVGLIQMLANLDDPNSIGPSMAVALLTTFYGALLSNMVFTPLAAKLERNAAEEMILNQLYVMAAASIGRQENPRRLEMLFNTILPPSARIDYFG